MPLQRGVTTLLCGEDSLERGLTPRSDVLLHSIVMHHSCLTRGREAPTCERTGHSTALPLKVGSCVLAIPGNGVITIHEAAC